MLKCLSWKDSMCSCVFCSKRKPHLVFTCLHWLIASSPCTTPGIHLSSLTDCLIPVYHTWYSRVFTDWLSHRRVPHLVFTSLHWLIASSPCTTPGIHLSSLTDCLIPMDHTWYSRVFTDWLFHVFLTNYPLLGIHKHPVSLKISVQYCVNICFIDNLIWGVWTLRWLSMLLDPPL